MNPLRVRILTDIDCMGFSLVTHVELAGGFRHEQHWKNWAAKWNLDVDPADNDVSFVRRPKAVPAS